MAKPHTWITKKWVFPGLQASPAPRGLLYPHPKSRKEKSVAIHVIIVKTMTSAKRGSAKKSLVHYTTQISAVLFLWTGQISSDLSVL